ncbi:hypothetical protein E2C01_076358 [Portunus trituberculatus]|uniref:Uncharacterized protein n=1 Tax=Portunus trituberculatus TaxID=210409 RepID=A0A5B7IJK6_PORTR|nr:hypothetical protein [Portunus trituberculatus]
MPFHLLPSFSLETKNFSPPSSSILLRPHPTSACLQMVSLKPTETKNRGEGVPELVSRRSSVSDSRKLVFSPRT